MSPLLLLALFMTSVLAVLLAFQAGLWFGRRRSQRPDPEPQLPVRTLVASILSLLAFILGFTFGLALSHYDARTQSTRDEAIALRRAYRRTDFLPSADRANVRRLLRQYIDVRLEVRQPSDLVKILPQLRQLQDEVWAQAVSAEKNNTGPHSIAPLLESLEDVIDVQGERRLAGFRSRIPLRVWLVLYGMMLVSVGAAGYLAGLAGARRSFAAVAYAVTFSAVTVMIAAADVPGPQQFRTNWEALTELRSGLAVP